MSKKILTEILPEVKFLNGIDRRHLERIADISQICDFDVNEIVFREGETADSIYLVVSGKLELDLQPADLVTLVERNVTLNRVLVERKQIELCFASDDGDAVEAVE